MKKSGFAVSIFFVIIILGFWPYHQNHGTAFSTSKNAFRDISHSFLPNMLSAAWIAGTSIKKKSLR